MAIRLECSGLDAVLAVAEEEEEREAAAEAVAAWGNSPATPLPSPLPSPLPPLPGASSAANRAFLRSVLDLFVAHLAQAGVLLQGGDGGVQQQQPQELLASVPARGTGFAHEVDSFLLKYPQLVLPSSETAAEDASSGSGKSGGGGGKAGAVSKRECQHEGCEKRPSFGAQGEKPVVCSQHKLPGMVDLVHKGRCLSELCDKQPAYGFKGERPRFCAKHKAPGMVDVKCGKGGRNSNSGSTSKSSRSSSSSSSSSSGALARSQNVQNTNGFGFGSSGGSDNGSSSRRGQQQQQQQQQQQHYGQTLLHPPPLQQSFHQPFSPAHQVAIHELILKELLTEVDDTVVRYPLSADSPRHEGGVGTGMEGMEGMEGRGNGNGDFEEVQRQGLSPPGEARAAAATATAPPSPWAASAAAAAAAAAAADPLHVSPGEADEGGGGGAVPTVMEGAEGGGETQFCCARGCFEPPRYGPSGGVPLRCFAHRSTADAHHPPRCSKGSCSALALFNFKGRPPLFCADHRGNGMMDVKTRFCEAGCGRRSSFAPPNEAPRFCSTHKEPGNVDVVHKRCEVAGCRKTPSYGDPVTKKRRFCTNHAGANMVSLPRQLEKRRRSGSDSSAARGAWRGEGGAEDYQGQEAAAASDDMPLPLEDLLGEEGMGGGHGVGAVRSAGGGGGAAAAAGGEEEEVQHQQAAIQEEASQLHLQLRLNHTQMQGTQHGVYG